MNNKNSSTRPPTPTEPKALLAQSWDLIQCGVQQRKHSYHAVYMSYIADNTPRSATLVPRHLDRQYFTLNCHTDIRSGKIKHLRINNQVCLLFWCREHKTQLRLNGTVKIQHDNTFTQAIWESLRPMSRVCYAADIAPSTETTTSNSGFTTAQWENRQTLCNSSDAYQHFAVLQVHIEMIERLDLRLTGHQKIRFKKSTSPVSQATWIHQWLAP